MFYKLFSTQLLDNPISDFIDKLSLLVAEVWASTEGLGTIVLFAASGLGVFITVGVVIVNFIKGRRAGMKNTAILMDMGGTLVFFDGSRP